MEKDFFKLAIIGNPLSHSVSPAMQEAALLSADLEGSYEKFETKLENLPETINYFKENNFSGFNITIPYKTEILKYLDETDCNAQKIGAVNTVKITPDKKLIGYNTDVYGFYSSLKKENLYDNAVLIGCGGAALAVVFGLEQAGCKNLTVYARNIDKANSFINGIKNKTVIKLSAQKLENLKDISTADIIINATPLGTKGENQDKMPVSEEIFSTAKKTTIAYDLVYNPAKTLFLKSAEKYGLKAINGLDMLVLQGAKAFEIWTGKQPNIDKMKSSIL